MIHLRGLLLLLALGSAPSLLADDWTGFRGPGGQGISTAKDLPAQWSEIKNVAWKAKLPGAGASSPIVLGDKLYLTCYSGYGTYPEQRGSLDQLTLHVVCLDSNGKISWDSKIKAASGESESVRDHGYAAPTPVSDGKHLYVFFGKSGVFKFDLRGKKIWRASVGSGTDRWGCGTSPVLYKGLVIVNASVESGSLIAINTNNGTEAWRAGGMKSAWNSPHLVELPDGKTELVISVKGKVLGFDPATGKSLWNCEGIQDYVCPSIVSKDGILYAIGGRTSRAIAIRAGGRGDVTESHRLWVAKAGANVSSPVIHDGHLYWVSDRKKVAYAVRLKDGEVVHEERVNGQPYASALLADGRVYVVTRHKGTLVFDAKPDFPLIATNKLGDRSTFNASPIAVDDRLYLRSDQHLYCISKN